MIGDMAELVARAFFGGLAAAVAMSLAILPALGNAPGGGAERREDGRIAAAHRHRGRLRRRSQGSPPRSPSP
jgi:hypothetical protein